MAQAAADHEGKGGFFLYAALAANFAIAIAKFVAASLNGSSAMVSEGLHSLVDTTNEILLLHGRRQGRKPPDRLHPLGYGREIYFWSFVVSLLIFATGACASLYEGVTRLLAPEPVHAATISYIVLLVSAILEATSWIFARRAFVRSARGRPSYCAVHRSKDPPTFIVFLEDSAALVGILIAAPGLLLCHATGSSSWDGAASILIGLLLSAVAAFLGREAKHLLIGESAGSEVEQRLRAVVRKAGGAVDRLVTIQLGPDSFYAAVSVRLPGEQIADAVALVRRVHERAEAALPHLRRLAVEPRIDDRPRAPGSVGGADRERPPST